MHIYDISNTVEKGGGDDESSEARQVTKPLHQQGGESQVGGLTTEQIFRLEDGFRIATPSIPATRFAQQSARHR